jgi:hypothetical protein
VDLINLMDEAPPPPPPPASSSVRPTRSAAKSLFDDMDDDMDPFAMLRD